MRIVVYCYQTATRRPSSGLDSLDETELAAVEQVYTDIALPTEPDFRPERDRMVADLQTHPPTGCG
jgi:hypothetical protein